MTRALLVMACLWPGLALSDPFFVDRSDALPAPHIYDGGWEHFVGGGTAVFDCNGDAYPDIFAAGGQNPSHLYENLILRGEWRFHDTGFRHCDLYFSHIFLGEGGKLYLIDLQRVFKPVLFKERFRVKDIAQLYYSAEAKYFSRSDRLHFPQTNS